MILFFNLDHNHLRKDEIKMLYINLFQIPFFCIYLIVFHQETLIQLNRHWQMQLLNLHNKNFREIESDYYLLFMNFFFLHFISLFMNFQVIFMILLENISLK